jgi:hypothetical protein
MNNAPSKCFKNIFFGTEIEKHTNIATHMDLWKYDQILTIQKFLTNNKFGMWINIKFNHTVLFIMKLLVSIKVRISRSKNILITTSIWIKGISGKNIVSSQKWTTIACIYPWRSM